MRERLKMLSLWRQANVRAGRHSHVLHVYHRPTCALELEEAVLYVKSFNLSL